MPEGPVALLLHEEDLHPESLPQIEVAALGGVCFADRRTVAGGCGDAAPAFAEGALADGLSRAGTRFGRAPVMLAPDALADWAAASGARAVVTPHAPAGWVADALTDLRPALAARGLTLHRVRRSWDANCWPLARKGFFPFRESIPRLVAELSPAAP
jgi:deoxyribodipyrimidine photo-lyase